MAELENVEIVSEKQRHSEDDYSSDEGERDWKRNGRHDSVSQSWSQEQRCPSTSLDDAGARGQSIDKTSPSGTAW